jgi:hypothetical protein
MKFVITDLPGAVVDVYILLGNADQFLVTGTLSSTPAFETFDPAHRDQYVLPTDEIMEGTYSFEWPAALSVGSFRAVAKRRVLLGVTQYDIPVGVLQFDPQADGPAVVVSPVGASVLSISYAVSAGGLRKNLSVFQNTRATFAWNIVDGNGQPVSIGGHSVKFVCHLPDADTVQFVVADEDIQILPSDPSGAPLVLDQVQVTIEPDDVDTLLGKYEYKLWDLTIPFVHGDGEFFVYRAPLPPAP